MTEHDPYEDLEATELMEMAIDELAEELARVIAVNQQMLEALKLADAALSGANMNLNVVEKKVRDAIAKAEEQK